MLPRISGIGTFNHQGVPNGHVSACDTDHSNSSVLFYALSSYGHIPPVWPTKANKVRVMCSVDSLSLILHGTLQLRTVKFTCDNTGGLVPIDSQTSFAICYGVEHWGQGVLHQVY